MALRERDPQVQYPLTRSAGSVLYALTALAFGNVIAALGDGIVAPSFLLFSILMFLWKLICQGGITLKLYIFLFRVCKPMIFTVPLKLNNNYL